MVWNVTQTVLSSVFGGTILACLLYGVVYRLRPHILRPKGRPDFTLPQAEQRPTNPQLRASLYSRPSTNFIDPRNSVADTDLMSTRWSTSVLDLDPPTSPVSSNTIASPRLPRSPCVDFRSPSRLSTRPPIGRPSLHGEASMTGKSGRALRPAKSADILGHKRQANSTPQADVGTMSDGDAIKARQRSLSDTAITVQQSLLSLSHALLSSREFDDVLISPTTSDFSGTTMLATPKTPSPSPGQILAGNTSKVVSPLRHQHRRHSRASLS